jgi:hypothetical protein
MKTTFSEKTSSRLGVLLLVIFAAAVVQQASASCGAASALISSRSDDYKRSFIFTEDVFAAHPLTGPNFTYYYDLVPPVTSQFKISFWALGLGGPGPLGGIDNGTVDPTTDFYFRSNLYNETLYYYGGELFTQWATGTDGCPGADACLGLLFDDENGQRGSFALVTTRTQVTFVSDFTQPDNAPIVLVPIDAPVVLDLQGTQTGMQLETAVPTPAGGGTYPLDGCPAVLQGNVYAQTVPAGSAAPSDRDRSLWTLISPTPGDLDASQFLNIECSDDQDVYLTASLFFDSGYETAYVSGNTGPLACLMISDADEDGYSIPDDCDDSDPLINPGAFELPGNEVDENCDGIVECDPTDYCIFGLYVSCVRYACEPLVDGGVIKQEDCNQLIQNNRRGSFSPRNENRQQFLRDRQDRGLRAKPRSP